MRDALHSMTAKRSTSSISGAGDDVAQVGEVIDLQGYEGCTFVINTGVLADANATFAVVVDHGDTTSVEDGAVDDADLISQGDNAPETDAAFAFGDDNEVRTIGYRGTKRYVRLTITPTGNTGAWPIGVVAILTHRRSLPFTQPSA